MDILIVLFSASLGAILASFLDVAAERFANGENLGGRSRCPHCNKTLGLFDLIPVVSWLMLAGKCRSCAKPIPTRHLVVESSCAALFGVISYIELPFILSGNIFFLIALALQCIILSALVLVFLADMRFTIIPDEAVIAITCAAIALMVLRYVAPGGTFAQFGPVIPSITSAVIGVIFGAGLLGSFTLVSGGAWMGLGDVKLAFAFGMLFGAPLVLFVLGTSFVIGAAVGLVLIAAQGKTLKSTMPFGPALVVAALVFMLLPHRTVSGLLEFFLLTTNL